MHRKRSGLSQRSVLPSLIRVYDNNNALEVIDGIKVEIIKGYGNNLWEYDFVYAWGKPDSISDEEFNTEKEAFDDSFKNQIEVVDDLTFERLLEEDNDVEEE